ncbi:MAG: CDP-glycerol glycerophosphotransferase family protein [Melioribacteraceae bacterium]|nr:CDP-glycerol glycerophosphotransferase family protein [Melioribacteraceae bacterium]
MSKKILFIGGSVNQTSMMHQISLKMEDCDCYFSPYYGDGYIDFFAKRGVLDFSILGGKFKKSTEDYIKTHQLKMDYKGEKNDYDLVFTGSDLIIPKNIRDKKVILVQEGMTDPENLMFHLVKHLGLPRWMASTSVTGLSDLYDILCVASEGYRDLFIRKGVKPEKIVVTGIPNFDNLIQYMNNDFPLKYFVLAATSDSRETFKYENRKKFILDCVQIANGKQLIFKLHPNENFDKATKEIEKYAPGALIYTSGDINEMIANCDILITKYSSVSYVGLCLGKEVHSYFDLEELKKLNPIQNNGTSAERIAKVALQLLEQPKSLPINNNEFQNISETVNV